jgi:2TM domain
MSNYQPAPEGKDPVLWEIAQKRASFKSHAVTYLIVNAFLWGIWYMSASRHNIRISDIGWRHIPWPIWPTLGWGLGLAFHFAGAYIFPRANSVETEYEKLKSKQKK